MIITIRPQGRKVDDFEDALHSIFSALPSYIFKSITFDWVKEFSNWKTICNRHDVSIFFANLGTLSQRGLNDYSNGILRRSGLDKAPDVNSVTDDHIIILLKKLIIAPENLWAIKHHWKYLSVSS